MQSKTITTFPFLFPPRPWEAMMISPLRKGTDGLFGVVIEPVIDLSTAGTTCSFFAIDLITGTVTRHEISLPNWVLVQMDLCYDQSKQVWIVALRKNGSPGPLDLYEVPHEAEQPWTLIFDANSLDDLYKTDKYLVAFWQQGNYFPLLFDEVDFALMYDGDLRWTHWRQSSVEQPTYQHLGTAYASTTHVSEENCLLLTWQCLYDAVVSDPVYRKKGPGQWCFIVTALAHDGTVLHQTRLPEATFRVRDMNVASHDWDWLELSMTTAEGPSYGPQRQRTCVVAAIMHDNPEKLKGLKRKRQEEQQLPGALSYQGGVYCLDRQGQPLSYRTDLVGLHMSLCSCGERVVGTMFKDGSQELWSWLPFDLTSSYESVTLSSQVFRATVIAPESGMTTANPWFWCIEEYQEGIRVVQRVGRDLREMQAIWSEGVSLPDWRHPPGTSEQRPHGIATYQDSLLVLGLNKDNRLQLLQFQ